MTRLTPKSYQQFIDTLYEDIDEIIKKLAKDRQAFLIKYQSAANDIKLFEDDINHQIVRALDYKDYRVSHDKFCNGHVDVYVELDNYPYIWLGECKIWSGASNIDTGFKQLNNAYSTGEDDECCGGVIVYFVDTDTTVNDLMGKWAAMLLEYNPPTTANTVKELKVWSEYDYKENRKRNRFYSSHLHQSSGLPYTVRHFALDLRHQRLD